MLIFQRHLPHVIPNSMQALHALSHSEITFRKAPSQYHKGGETGGAGGAIAPPLFTDHFKNYILFDNSDRKLLLTFLTQKQV